METVTKTCSRSRGGKWREWQHTGRICETRDIAVVIFRICSPLQLHLIFFLMGMCIAAVLRKPPTAEVMLGHGVRSDRI